MRSGSAVAHRGRVALVVLVSSLACACAGPRYISAPPRVVIPAQPASSVTRHVLLISIDGLRGDAIERFAAPTLQTLAREGSYTYDARTIVPSKTLPSHTSMLTGEPPERHGVLWNNVLGADSNRITQQTVFGVSRAHGYVTAAFFSKPKFQPLQQEGALDYSQAPGGWFGGWRSSRTTDDVERYLSTARPNLLFVHLIDPDRAGHDKGWMSPAYGAAVLTADAAVARLIAKADAVFGAGSYTVIVTADHGGHDRDHGSADPRDVAIPWIAWGHGVVAGHLSPGSVKTVDTASTVLWLLGLDEPAAWAGSPVTAAFRADRP